MTQNDIISRINSLFQKDAVRRFKLTVSEESIQQDGDWWYVPIYPRADQVRAFDYAPFLNEIEEEFKNENVNVLLVPAEAVSH